MVTNKNNEKLCVADILKNPKSYGNPACVASTRSPTTSADVPSDAPTILTVPVNVPSDTQSPDTVADSTVKASIPDTVADLAANASISNTVADTSANASIPNTLTDVILDVPIPPTPDTPIPTTSTPYAESIEETTPCESS